MSEAWQLEATAEFRAALSDIDGSMRNRIIKTLQAIADSGQPRARGKALTGNLAGLWRYRIGDWRLIVDIRDNQLCILQIEVGHRSAIYD